MFHLLYQRPWGQTNLPLNASTQLALVLRASQGNEHTASLGTCSESSCRAMTGAEDVWAANPSGCGHGVEAWPVTDGNKVG